MNPEENIARFRESYNALRSEIGKVIVGQEAIVDGTLNALFANGHFLGLGSAICHFHHPPTSPLFLPHSRRLAKCYCVLQGLVIQRP